MTYLDEKLNEAKEYVNSIIGIKEEYTFNDALKLLKSFSYTQEIDFDELAEFIPASLHFANLYEFTNGFIDDNSINQMYALNYGTGFIIIVLSSLDGKNINSYYGNTINDFTLRIYYALEIMCKNMTN